MGATEASNMLIRSLVNMESAENDESSLTVVGIVSCKLSRASESPIAPGRR